MQHFKQKKVKIDLMEIDNSLVFWQPAEVVFFHSEIFKEVLLIAGRN